MICVKVLKEFFSLLKSFNAANRPYVRQSTSIIEYSFSILLNQCLSLSLVYSTMIINKPSRKYNPKFVNLLLSLLWLSSDNFPKIKKNNKKKKIVNFHFVKLVQNTFLDFYYLWHYIFLVLSLSCRFDHHQQRPSNTLDAKTTNILISKYTKLLQYILGREKNRK